MSVLVAQEGLRGRRSNTITIALGRSSELDEKTMLASIMHFYCMTRRNQSELTGRLLPGCFHGAGKHNVGCHGGKALGIIHSVGHAYCNLDLPGNMCQVV